MKSDSKNISHWSIFIKICCLFVSCITYSDSDKSSTLGDMSPNFIIIYIDDMGFSDFGPFSDKTIKTPNLDKLASEGQIWTNFYSAASVCSPSRAALLTGKLPISTGLYGDKIGVFFPSSKRGISHELQTLPELLKAAGYNTGLFGKWHLGDNKKYYPTEHGFNEWVGIPYSNDMDWQVNSITSSNIFLPWEDSGDKWSIVSKVLRARIFDPKVADWQVPLLSSYKKTNGDTKTVIVEKPINQHLSVKTFTEHSIRFIQKSSNDKSKFFMILAHSMPHVPLFTSDNFSNKSEKGIYGDVIEEIDWSVGQVISALDSFNLSENTYLIFTSDNGPWLTYESHAGNSDPLRGGKGTSFEGGMRALTLFTGPDVHNGEVSGLGVQTDLFNTILDLAKLETRKDLKNSFNLAATIKKNDASPRDFVPFYVGSELRAFRLRDHKIHFVTQGAFGAPPKRKIHSPPVLINLIKNQEEDFRKNIENDELLESLLQRVNEFNNSIIRKSSIFDVQYE